MRRRQRSEGETTRCERRRDGVRHVGRACVCRVGAAAAADVVNISPVTCLECVAHERAARSKLSARLDELGMYGRHYIVGYQHLCIYISVEFIDIACIIAYSCRINFKNN